MKSIPVVYKTFCDAPPKGYWDHAILTEIIFDDVRLKKYGIKIEERATIEGLEGAIVVIPGRYHSGLVGELNSFISRLSWVVLIITGDEEAVFPIDEVAHGNIRIWAMSPHQGRYKNIDRMIPNGYAPGTFKELKEIGRGKREYTWSFSGQNTHSRRAQLVDSMRPYEENTVHKTYIHETEGFTQGLPHNEFMRLLSRTKTAPCPSGAVVQDSFRAYEALEAGCAVLLDKNSPNGVSSQNYFDMLFGEHPFVQIEDWNTAFGYAVNYGDRYPEVNNIHFSWWQGYKRELSRCLAKDLQTLGAYEKVDSWTNVESITVLIPTSPIPSHPSTDIIEETIRTVRERLSDVEIVVMFDGVREEQQGRKADYETYKQRMLWKINFEYENVTPIVFDEHLHQAEMTRRALELVDTDIVMFVEHDTPICENIPFSQIITTLKSGHIDLLRLNHEALILPDHEHLMYGRTKIGWLPVVQTAQWSQRPHLARTEFYKRILHENFSESSRTMIEDVMHGVVAEGYKMRGRGAWNDYKLAIYAPDGDMKRSYHLDGRGGESKYSMKK